MHRMKSCPSGLSRGVDYFVAYETKEDTERTNQPVTDKRLQLTRSPGRPVAAWANMLGDAAWRNPQAED